MTDDELAALGIDDSRRLMGPNLFDMQEGAVLDVRLTEDPRRTRHLVHAWQQAVRRFAGLLDWPEPRTAHRTFVGGATLFLHRPAAHRHRGGRAGVGVGAVAGG